MAFGSQLKERLLFAASHRGQDPTCEVVEHQGDVANGSLEAFLGSPCLCAL